jgi:hypothetical protein
MADVERIAPPVPTLPPPVGRNVGSNKRRKPGEERRAPRRSNDEPPRPPADSEHIDEYV